MFAADVVTAMRKHAAEDYPREACGLVVDGKYVRCENKAENPERGYEIDLGIYESYGDAVQGVVHSHPDGPEYPSIEDMRSAEASAVPNGIVCAYSGKDGTQVATSRPFFWGPGVKRLPLMNRTFRHGVTDCYAAIRDWYLEVKGVELPDYPRDWSWWQTGGDMYRLLYADAGFREFRAGEKPRAGDVFLASIRAKGVVNHAGVYLGNDQIFHHPTTGYGYAPDSLSTRVSASRYVNSSIFCGWIRHDPVREA